MPGKTKIQWTDVTLNPATGCTKISPGCQNCYAERFAERWRGIKGHAFEQGFDLKLHPKRLNIPGTWRKPRMVFVNSMSDLFHEKIPTKFIRQTFITMQENQKHTFQVLTKRANLMRLFIKKNAPVPAMTGHIWGKTWTPKNIWLGVSVENQYFAEKRIPLLIETGAHVKFLSIEPMLGPVDLSMWLKDLSWIIVGGESGPGARQMDTDWARSIRDQCKEQEVPFFFKQVGGVRKKEAGRLLDGKEYNEMPNNKVLV